MSKEQELKLVASKVSKAVVRRLDRAAKMGGRTRSAEVRLRLERSLSETPDVALPTPDAPPIAPVAAETDAP